jgi:hypothetical protein
MRKMLSGTKFYWKLYSIIAVSILGMRIFLNKKTSPFDLVAIVPTFIYLCNV